MDSGWAFAVDLLIVCVFWVVGVCVCFDYVGGGLCFGWLCCLVLAWLVACSW